MMVEKRVRKVAGSLGNRWQTALIAVALGSLPVPVLAQALIEASDRLCTAGFNEDYGWFALEAPYSGKLGALEIPGMTAGQCVETNDQALRVQLGDLKLPLTTSDTIASYFPGPDAQECGTEGATPLACVTFELNEPVLCENYYAGSGGAGWKFKIKDVNGDGMPLRMNLDEKYVSGVVSLEYGAVSEPYLIRPTMADTTKQWLRCYSGLAENWAGLTPINTAPGGGEDPAIFCPGGLDGALFCHGFEDPSGPNLQVGFLYADRDEYLPDDVAEQPTTPANSTVTYRIRVRNVGGGTAYGVRAREFVPRSTTLLSPTVTRGTCEFDRSDDGVIGNFAPCTSGGSDASALYEDIGTLAPGAYVDYRVTRKSSSTLSSTPQLALVQVAVFSDPATTTESEYRDNSRTLRIKLVDNYQIVRGISTNGIAGGPGGTISLMTLPGDCTDAGNTTTCMPSVMGGLVFVATANPGYTFAGFEGCLPGTLSGKTFDGGNWTTGSATSCTLTAKFHGNPTVTADVTPSGDGAAVPVSSTIRWGDNDPATVEDDAVFIITPAAGKEIDTVTGSGCAPVDNGDGTWTAANVQSANCHAAVAFKASRYSVSLGFDGGFGEYFVPPSGVVDNLLYNEPASFQFKATDGIHEIESVVDTCGPGGTHSGATPVLVASAPVRWYLYNVVAVTHTCTVTAKFRLITHMIAVDPALSHGSIELAEAEVVHNTNAEFTVVPDNGYHYVQSSIAGSSACGSFGGDAANGTIATDASVSIAGTAGPIAQDGCILTAAFARNEYNLTISQTGGNGTLGAYPSTVLHGDDAQIQTVPANGYHAAFTSTTPGACSVLANPTVDNQTYTDTQFDTSAITGHCALNVSFVPNTYTVTATAGAGGTISPSGEQVFPHGTNTFFTVTPDSGYVIDSVTGCGGNLAGSIYLVSVTSNCAVTATFAPE